MLKARSRTQTMKTKITIDARWLVGGIGAYTRHLLQGLHAHGNGFEVHAITRAQHTGDVEPCCARMTVVNASIYTLREQWAIPRAAKGSDLLHVPHYNAPLFEPAPLVVTIHDIIHITDPDEGASLKAWIYAQPMLRAVARKAHHIITVSEYSKEQIVERLGVPPSNVSAIARCVDAEFQPINREEALKAVCQALDIDSPYLLYVGNLKRHKNVSTLLEAFTLLREWRDVPQRLLILGDDAHGKRELAEQCAKLGITDRVRFVPYVSQELLRTVYAAAEAMVMPSRLEGFGLPVLEAMACGTPVVCSRAASLPEVGGEAVVYFDPSSPEELADAIGRVLDSAELRQSLRARGLARAAQFTWKQSVEKHAAVYKSVLG